MKPNILHTITLPILALLTILASCRDEETVTMPSAQGAGLYIALTVSGETPTLPVSSTTRASVIEGENDLDENMVERMDFFHFASNGTLKKHVSKKRNPSTTTEKPSTTGETNKDGEVLKYYTTDDYCTLYTGSTWKSNLVAGDILYAVVNMDWSKASTTSPDSIQSLDQLKSLAYTDADIYLKKQEEDGKPFLMDGCHTFTQDEIDAYSATAMNSVTVDVRRAAAKVKVNIFKNSNWKNWEGKPVATIGTITASLNNYATHTKVLADGTDVSNRGLTSIKHVPDNGKTAISPYPGGLSNKTNTDGSTSEYANSILIYTFANDWTDNVGNETSLELNIPYTTIENEVKYPREHNYYKIVFLPNDNGQLKRNTFYEVDIDVKNDGATVSEEPVEVTELKWKVADWKNADVNVKSEDVVDYLILSDYYIDLRNEDMTDITFYSSNPVTVEVVGFAKETDLNSKPNTNEETTILETLQKEGFTDYPGNAYTEKNGYKEIPGVFYVDKESRRVDITDDLYATARAYYGDDPVKVSGYKEEADRPTLGADGDIVHIAYDNNATKEGLIHLYSRIPENVTPRYITLKVTMPTKAGGTLTRYAVVVQYPLEYVVGVQGLYSYMDGTVKNRDNDGTTVYDVAFGTTVDATKSNFDGTYYYAHDFETYFNAANKGTKIIIPDEVVFGPTDKTSGTWRTSSAGNSGYGLDGHMARGGNMKCKFFRAEDTWTDSEGTHHGMIYQIDRMYQDNAENNAAYPHATVQIFNNKSANNNNMYEVVVTATSTQYHIGYPEMESESDETAEDLKVAVSSAENNNLLAPRFAFASQLGNNSAMKYWEVARDQCKHYVEVGTDGTVYDNWRLPTIAELSIIKNYQLDQNVYDITMNKVVNSDGDTNPLYWTAERDVFVHTTGAGTKDKQKYYYEKICYTYTASTKHTEKYIRTTKTYRTPSSINPEKPEDDDDDWTLYSTKDEDNQNLGSGHKDDGTENLVSVSKLPEIAVRCRCVRDIRVVK